MRRRVGWVLFLLLLSPASGWARATSASANIFLPAIDESRYFSIYSSQTLQKLQFRTGVYFHLSQDPLEVGAFGVRRFGVVDNLLVGDFFGALGVTDWFQLGLSVPVALYEDFNDLVTGDSEKSFHMMDMRFETKFRFVDIDRRNVGFAILPYILIPTGDGDRFVGNNSFAGGGKAVLDFDIADRVQISTNLGYFARDRVFVSGTEQNDALTYGLGLNVRATKKLDLIGEVYGSTLTSSLFGSESEMPLEADGGVRYNFSKPEGLQLTAGAGMGLTFGYGSPDYRVITGLSYLKPRRIDLPVPPPPPEEDVLAKLQREREQIIIIMKRKIHFEFDKAVIRPISFQILNAVVEVLKDNPNLLKVRIEAHCDSKGSDKYNMRLSQKRAQAVQDYLVAHGVSADRLVALGYGETRPVATNDTPEGRARNRRVEFTILEEQQPQAPAPATTTP